MSTHMTDQEIFYIVLIKLKNFQVEVKSSTKQE